MYKQDITEAYCERGQGKHIGVPGQLLGEGKERTSVAGDSESVTKYEGTRVSFGATFGQEG